MNYTTKELALLSGVSTRALRYYDQIGLLCPARDPSNGYRIYSRNEVDRLQQILLYRELEVPLEKIKALLDAPGYNRAHALEGHLSALLQRRNQMDLLIRNIAKTIQSLKGEIIMDNKEKFEGFKKQLIEDNEAAYGKEIRKKYGEETIDASNETIRSMDEEAWENAQSLSIRINEALKEAFAQGNPAGKAAQDLCELHRQWLCMFWKKGTYTKKAHAALAEGYVADERFRAYYDNVVPGGAEFFRDALCIYCQE